MGHLLSKYIFHGTALSAVHVVVQWKQYILVNYNDRVDEKSSTHSPLLLFDYIYLHLYDGTYNSFLLLPSSLDLKYTGTVISDIIMIPLVLWQ